jgi:hypothetical protein
MYKLSTFLLVSKWGEGPHGCANDRPQMKEDVRGPICIGTPHPLPMENWRRTLNLDLGGLQRVASLSMVGLGHRLAMDWILTTPTRCHHGHPSSLILPIVTYRYLGQLFI